MRDPETETLVESEPLVLWVSYLPFLSPVVKFPTLAVLLKVMPDGIFCFIIVPSEDLAFALEPVVSNYLPTGVILIFSFEIVLEEIE
jgi:hypothetical protein